MLKSFVVKGNKYFTVKTGKVNDFGFTNIKTTDRFNTLAEANKKADLCNYIFSKISEVHNG